MIFESGFEAVREVARHGSFTNAAKALGISGPAVSRQVKSLEERLGLVLFHRTTRTVTLTEAGQQLVDTLDRGSDEVSGLIERLAEGQERPFGKLKLNAPMAFGEKFLVEPIAEYASLYPDVTVDIEFDDKRVHLVEEGYDLIIRIGALEDSGLIATKLCDFPAIICASPEFLAHYGLPKTPSELTRLPAVVYSNSASGNSMNYRTLNGNVGVVNLAPAIYANTIGMLLEATKQGLGFSRLPEVFCAEAISDGTLIEILSEYDLIPDRAIFAMYPEKRYLPLKVRKFIDHLSARLSVMKNHAPDRRIAAVTTFHAAGYDQYGKRFLESFEAHWPKDVVLHIYGEDVQPYEASERFVYHNLLAEVPALADFKARHKGYETHNGIYEDGEYGYRMDAVRFSHKVFALTHCALTLQGQADVLFWIDADTVTLQHIPAGLFATVLPEGCYTSYLGRPHTYPECGFVGYDLTHPAHEEFMTFWRQLYLDDTLFEFPEWHDSFVYDLIRKTFEEKGKFKSFDIAANAPPSDHPFINSVLGDYMDHLKGDERKEAGESFEQDYVRPAKP